MSYRDIMHFLIAVEDADEPGMITFELERLLGKYKLFHYALFHQPRPFDETEDLVLAWRSPEGWQQRYLGNGYIGTDPTIRYLNKANHPYRWADALKAQADSPHFARMAAMMKDAARHGLVDGAVFPVHGAHGLLGALSIGGDECDLSPAEMSLFATVARRAWWRMGELKADKRMDQGERIDPSVLSQRSLQAVSLLAEGKTSAEIAAVMGVSMHTVDWHFNNIQQKLGAKNRYQILTICLRGGLIS